MKHRDETEGFGVILWGLVAVGAIVSTGVLWILFGSR